MIKLFEEFNSMNIIEGLSQKEIENLKIGDELIINYPKHDQKTFGFKEFQPCIFKGFNDRGNYKLKMIDWHHDFWSNDKNKDVDWSVIPGNYIYKNIDDVNKLKKEKEEKKELRKDIDPYGEEEWED